MERGKTGKTGKTGKRGMPGIIPPEMLERLARIETLCSGESEWRKHVDARFDGIGKSLSELHSKLNTEVENSAYQRSQIERNTKRLDSLDNIDTGAVTYLQQEVRSLSTIAKTWATVAGVMAIVVSSVVRLFWKISG
jgi:hypothetical protein